MMRRQRKLMTMLRLMHMMMPTTMMTGRTIRTPESTKKRYTG
ncbi:MAG: hypothetical protein ACKOB6_01200 [Candidatus Kapaibacterium sp.]